MVSGNAFVRETSRIQCAKKVTARASVCVLVVIVLMGAVVGLAARQQDNTGPGENASPVAPGQVYEPMPAAYDPDFPIQEPDVVEFNATGPVNPDANGSVIYQYGHAEMGAFYSVSGNTIKNYSRLHTQGFNLSLPTAYYPFWNLSHVNYFNLTSIVNHDMDENYVVENATHVPLALDATLTTANATSVQEVRPDYLNLTAVQIHFAAVTLNPGERLAVYNASFDTTAPAFEVTTTGWSGWTDWIPGASAVVVLNGSATTAPASPTSYVIDAVRVNGTPFRHHGTDQYKLEVDPDIIGYNVTLANLYLPDASRFLISDPEGTNVTEIWRYDGLGVDPRNNWSVYFDGDGDALGGGFGPGQWVMPDYGIFKMYTPTGEEANCNFTISKVEYNTTRGWQRFYFPVDNYGDAHGNFLTYTPFGQNVTVNFTRLLGYGGDHAGWDEARLQACYSSWTFIFLKRPFDVNLTVFEIDPDTLVETALAVPVTLQSGKAYRFQVNVTDALNQTAVDQYNFAGETNPVRLDVWQDFNLVLTNATTTLFNGVVNFTTNATWGTTTGIHAGDVQLQVQVNNTNHCALNNLSARATWRYTYYEHPNLTLNAINAEYPAREWHGLTRALNVTAGTLFDPNTLTFNLSARDIYGAPEPLNGQAVTVEVTRDEVPVTTAEIYQNYHAADGGSYALFNSSFNQTGAWQVTFTLQNATLGAPTGYFLPTGSLVINVTATARPFQLDLSTGPAGLQPGLPSEIYCHITDAEEVSADAGVPFPLTGWTVDLYYVGELGLNYEKHFLGTSTTNTTGDVKVTWLPPLDLASQVLAIYVEARTPTEKLVQYEPEAALLQYGFGVDTLATTVQANATASEYYFDQPLQLDAFLHDELGNPLTEHQVILQTTRSDAVAYTNYFTIGTNNTNFVLDLTPFVGTVTLDANYEGSTRYDAAVDSRLVTYKKAGAVVDVDVDPEGYTYQAGDFMPINVSVLDNRTSALFLDSGVLTVQILNETRDVTRTESFVLSPSAKSNITIPDWNVTRNGMYYVNVTYSGGAYHESASVETEVLVERADVSLAMRPLAVTAGHPAVFEADATYAHNGSVVSGLDVVFEYVDQLGNSYVLGINTTDARGYVNFSYPVTGVYYAYMVEFGGAITATSRMDLITASGYDRIPDFQITKSPSQVLVNVQPASGNNVLVTLTLDTYGNLVPAGETLEVEIWAQDGGDYQKLTKTLPSDSGTLVFTHLVARDGNYNIRVIYRGSRLIDPAATIEIFDRERGSYPTPGAGSGLNAAGAQFHAHLANPGNPVFLFLLEFLCVVGPLFVITLAKRHRDRDAKRRLWAVLLVGIFAVSGLHMIFVTNSNVPYAEERVSNLAVNSRANFGWVENENLPEEDLVQYGAAFTRQAGQTSSRAGLEAGTDSGTGTPGTSTSDLLMQDLMAELGIATSNIPNTAQANAREVSVGAIGALPYPIGDTLNVSFTTIADSNFFIVISDINLNRRVQSIYGSSSADETQNIFIPIEAGTFRVGGQYALDLNVYRVGEMNYQARDSRRMTFNVIRGFSQVEISVPNVEVYQNRFFTISVTEDYTGAPLVNEDLYITVFDEETSDYELLTLATTDSRGQVVLPLPENDEQQEVPVRVVYNGDENHYGSSNSTSYLVNPIDTRISLSASPAYYTDEGRMTAQLTDQYGNRLANKELFFSVHVENKTIGKTNLVEIVDQWHDLGNVTTDAQGVATITFPVIYPEGNYEVMALFYGDAIYNESRATGRIFEVYKEPLTIEFGENHLYYGHQGLLTATLTDDDGNETTYTDVTFSAYVNHRWVPLGSVTTSGVGEAILQYTPYFDEGTYPLRLVKQEDQRYASQLAYGEVTIHRSNSSLDVQLGAGEYLDEVALSARLAFENGSLVEPLAGESVLFYLEQEMPDASTQFNYIGYGVTDANGLAVLSWTAQDRLPGLYTVKAFFPGNDFAASVEQYEYGLEILKGSLRVEGKAPSQVPVMDYADFAFNLSRKVDDQLVFGETLHLEIYNVSDPTDVLTEADIQTDVHGEAFFRWVPGHPGNFTFEATLVSDYYQAAPYKSQITVTRKGVNFNVTVSGTKFYRGDTYSLSGKTSIIYKYYNGTTTVLPATSVPLRFYIWNESDFVHPVSGFLVPNVPVKNTAGEYVAYSGDNPTPGIFSWSFTMPDEYYGLQSGRYFLKIRVDTTKTGLYTGETYISFDLVEHTTMSLWIKPSTNATDAQDRDDVPTDHSYFVEELEEIHIQLQDQDGVGLQENNYEALTERDLKINLGRDPVLYFHVDGTNAPSIYEYKQGGENDLSSMKNLTSSLQPTFDIDTGNYSFQYRPYYSGTYDVSVSYPGDRFFDPATATVQRVVYRRPTFLETYVSHITDLYRETTPYDWVQKWTTVKADVRDVLNGTPVDDKTVAFTFDGREMESASHNFSALITSASGHAEDTWWIPDWVQSGDHPFTIRVTETRVWAEHRHEYTLETWETARVTLSHKGKSDKKEKWEIGFYDQDDDLISEADFCVTFWGKVTSSKYVGGPGRDVWEGFAENGRGELQWDPSGSKLANGDYHVIIDFLGDDGRNLRPTSKTGKGQISLPLRGGGIDDTLYYDSAFGTPYEYPYSVWSGGDVYQNLQEARRLEDAPSSLQVNTIDGYGYVDGKDAYYVWQKNTEALHYYPLYNAKMPAIIAFGNLENALRQVESSYGAQARLVGWDFVFPDSDVPNRGPGWTGADFLLPALTVHEEPSPTLTGYLSGLEFGDLNYQIPASDASTGAAENGTGSPLLPPGDDKGPANSTLHAATLDQLSGGSGFSAAKLFARIFGSIADTAEFNRLRATYVLIFKLLEYFLSGGKVFKPGPDTYSYTREEIVRSSLTMEFEDTGLGVSTATTTAGALSASIQGGVKKYGSYALQAQGSIQATPGDQVIVPIDQDGNRSAARYLRLWVRYEGAGAPERNAGIKLKFVEPSGRWLEYDLSGTLPADAMWTHVEIPLVNFTGTGRVNLADEMVFEVVSGGMLTSAGSRFHVDRVEWVVDDIDCTLETVGGRWVREDLDEWFKREFILYFIVRPIYEAFTYAISRIPALFWWYDVFTWNWFKSSVESIIGASSGKKSATECLTDIFSYLLGLILSSAGKGIMGIYSARSKSTNMLRTHNRALSIFDRNQAAKSLSGNNLKKLLIFLVTMTMQEICMAIPTYYFDPDDTWDAVMVDGEKNVLKLIKRGFGVVNLKNEILLIVASLILGLVDFIGKNSGSKLFAKITRVLSAGGFAALDVYLTGKAQQRTSHANTLRQGTRFDPSNLVKSAVGMIIVFLLIDLVIEVLIQSITVPPFWAWMLQYIVATLLKTVIAIYLYPAELGGVPVKIVVMIILSMVIDMFVMPPLLRIVNEGIEKLLSPFGRTPAMGWSDFDA